MEGNSFASGEWVNRICEEEQETRRGRAKCLSDYQTLQYLYTVVSQSGLESGKLLSECCVWTLWWKTRNRFVESSFLNN